MNILFFLISFAFSAGITALLVILQVYRYRKLSSHPWKDIFSHKATLIAYVILRMLAIFALIRGIVRSEYESVLYCTLALILFEMPMYVSKTLKIEFSPLMEIIVLVFIYAAEIMGEVESYYVLVPGWDTALHTTNGFLCAAIGFCLVDMLNRNQNLGVQLSPFFVALVAFCFSMTVGVLWEFFEFTGDYFFAKDMQKDFLVTHFGTIYLDATKSNISVIVKDIQRTVIECADGTSVIIEGGYLDLGIIDTMKDLTVNAIGAIVFSVIGYFCAKQGKDSAITRVFVPLVKRPSDILIEQKK